MADEDLSLNEDQLLDSLDDANGDSELMNEVRRQYVEECFRHHAHRLHNCTLRMTAITKSIRS